MAWSKESLERANQSIEEFGEELPEHSTSISQTEQDEVVLARVENDFDYDYTLSEINGSFLFKSFDSYEHTENQQEVDEPTALLLIQKHKMQLTDEGTKRLGGLLSEKEPALLPSPAPEQPQAAAVNADGTKVFIGRELDLKNAEIERYEVTQKDCYTFHPEKDVLDEIFNRIHTAEMVIVSYEEFLEHTSDYDCVVYANILNHDVDLRLSDLKEGFDVSIPITADEKEQVRQAAEECEKDHESARHLPKQPDKAERRQYGDEHNAD